MEKDTVLLGVEKYNELRDFKKQIEEGKILSFYYYGYEGIRSQSFLTNDEALLKAKEINTYLEKQGEELKKQISKMKEPEKPKEVSINDLKKMSYWEFRKWRKS